MILSGVTFSRCFTYRVVCCIISSITAWIKDFTKLCTDADIDAVHGITNSIGSINSLYHVSMYVCLYTCLVQPVRLPKSNKRLFVCLTTHVASLVWIFNLICLPIRDRLCVLVYFFCFLYCLLSSWRINVFITSVNSFLLGYRLLIYRVATAIK